MNIFPQHCVIFIFLDDLFIHIILACYIYFTCGALITHANLLLANKWSIINQLTRSLD
jgi:hypothetical protein